MKTNALNTRKQLVLFQLFSVLLLLSRAPRALAVDDDRHYRDDADRDINDEGADTEFTCNVLDGKFRDTSGPNAVVTYAYELEYLKEKSPTHLASRVTHHISKGVISSIFQGCKNSDDRRRIEETMHMGRSLASAGGDDLIVGFETTPEVKPARGRECDTQPPSRDHACMVFSGGITIYFPDDKRRKMQGETDFGRRFSYEDHAIQEINHLVKNTIEYGKIAQKVSGIQKLTYKILPVTDEPSDMPSSVPSDKPSSLPTAEETSKNEVIATLKETPSTSNGGGALPIAMVVLAIVVCSIVGALYVKKRREMKESRKEQAEEEMEAADVLLDTYVPTGEMVRPLATEQGVVEVIWDEEERS